jgi:hypothetical protein
MVARSDSVFDKNRVFTVLLTRRDEVGLLFLRAGDAPGKKFLFKFVLKKTLKVCLYPVAASLGCGSVALFEGLRFVEGSSLDSLLSLLLCRRCL